MKFHHMVLFLIWNQIRIMAGFRHRTEGRYIFIVIVLSRVIFNALETGEKVRFFEVAGENGSIS